MEKTRMVKFVVLSSVALVAVAVVFGLALSSALGADGGEAKLTAPAREASGAIALAIAVSVASGALGAGYAVGKVGSAAIGAASERPEMMGRALVFVVIAEGIAVWGLVGAILLIGKL